MKVGHVDPSKSISSDITVIESNSGIADYIPDRTTKMTKRKANALRRQRGQEHIQNIASKEAKRKKVIDNYKTMNSTQLKDVTDVTSLRMDKVLDVNSLDLTSKGLPNPSDYGKTNEEVMALTSVDGSEWPLPSPDLAKLDPKCFDIGDMYMSSLVDLSGMDMRSWDLPTFDFSFATDWSFPAGMDPSSILPGDLFDLSNIDLGGIIDLSSVSLPKWDIPDGWDVDWDFDTSFEFGELTSIFDGMGSDGDLLGMGSLSMDFNGISCLGAGLSDLLSPGAIGDAFSNFELPDFSLPDLPNLDGLLGDGFDLSSIADKLDIDGFGDWGLPSDIFNGFDLDLPSYLGEKDDKSTTTEAEGPIMSAISYLGDKWWWYDEPMKKYHFDRLARMSPHVLAVLKRSAKHIEVVHAANGLRAHKDRYELG